MTIDRSETWKEKNRRAATNVMGHFLMRPGDNSSRHSSSSAPTRRLRETVRGVSSNFKLLFRCFHLLASIFLESETKIGCLFSVIEKVSFFKKCIDRVLLFRSNPRNDRSEQSRKLIFSLWIKNSGNDRYFEYLNLRISLTRDFLKKKSHGDFYLQKRERGRERKQNLVIRNLNSLSFGIKFKEFVVDERMKSFIS